jgi:spore germination cell wall hydrolase CwlJ-like protein
LKRTLIGIAARNAIRILAAGAVALLLSSAGFAYDVQIAEIQPDGQSPQPQALQPADTAQAPATSLTPDVLAAYVARQQAKKGFNIFGDAPQPELTSAMVSAYAATHYSNSALDAIDSAAAPSVLRTGFVLPDPAPADAAQSSVTDDMLARYARGSFQPTERKIAHANAEKLCLTNAIYHEARGETDSGQWAVANVVINRAMSNRFPTTMCGVIYQNADQGRYRCQFSFACDGRPDMATERGAWSKANRIASAAFSEFQRGQRPGVVPGNALFYHTRSVSPAWSGSYHQVAQIGAHVFYSPL